MDKIQYLANTAEVVRYYNSLSFEDLVIRQGMLNNFGVASLTLSYFLKSTDASSHQTIIKEILAFQQVSILGQQCPLIAKDVILNESIKQRLKDLKTSPQVIATFHFGSYRLLNLLLLEHDVPFSLIISTTTITEQSREFFRLTEEFYKKRITLLDAESPTCVISMVREIKKGNSLVIYLDGNIGAGGKAKENNLCSISFLDGKLHVRKGAAYLSHITKVPIFAATCFLKNYTDIYYDFSDSIMPNHNIDRETYALSTMQEIYTYFSGVLKQHPEQWEAWFYLHKNIDSSLVTKKYVSNAKDSTEKNYDPARPAKFNLRDFSLFKTGSEYYALDKRTFLSYPLEQDAYAILIDSLVSSDFKCNAKNTGMVHQLIKSNLLVQE